MKSRTKGKLLLSVIALLVAMVAAVSTTYAWFAMNTTVTVTGMKVSTKVDSNLSIASSTLNATVTVAENTFESSLSQTREGKLEPVSTINATAFYYTATNNADESGDATDDVYVEYSEATTLANTNAGKTNYDSAFQINYGFTGADTANVCYGYIDYIFQLKALNTTATTNYVNLTEVEMTYSGLADASKAYRVAVFVEEGTSAKKFAGTIGTLKTILTPTSAANQTDGAAVNSTTTTAAVTYNTAANLGSVATSATKYFKVVVRLFLEGEDTTCNNSTFMALTKDWNLDLTIKLEAATGGVTAIDKLITIDASDAVVSGTATLTSYYEVTGAMIDGKKVYTTDTDANFDTESELYTMNDDSNPTTATQITEGFVLIA